jgi:crotonobetainyl-CoA:carnitine CoA-transferase CaiB-like acyl-CoA transferase
VVSSKQALDALWQQAALPSDALQRVTLTGQDPVLPSSFAVGAAAQASIAAAALAATQVGVLRGLPAHTVSVDMPHAALECLTHFAIDGRVPDIWDKYSGVYRAQDGWVRIHANFAHHRDGALALLGLKAGEGTSKADVEKALQAWHAQDFEQAAAERGLVVAALRTHAQWLAHPQAAAIAEQPLFAIEDIAAPAIFHWASGQLELQKRRWSVPRQPASAKPALPLQGLRVLDLTRILAGPICGRALAAYGADVLLINAAHLPNIEAIADTSRGKRSAQLDLRSAQGKAALRQLIADADIFVQGYRPGALQALGFGPEDVAAMNPHIVYVSLSAYGDHGPWAQRRGFDSLVQTATGFNADESAAAQLNLATDPPRALPMQILDHATGYLMAFAALAAIMKQKEYGGAHHVRLSLARTGLWLRTLGRVDNGFATAKPSLEPYLYTEPSGFGQLTGLTHSARLSGAELKWALPAMPPGTHPAEWPH